jgi:NAD(P)-dependent dehydrogenase (short-subunit alcohol dehydrogenase family)
VSALTGIEGRTALITEADTGTGRAVALALAEAGASVAIHASDGADRAALVVEEARGHGVDAVAVTGDLTDPGAAHAVADQAQASLGPVDVLVHSSRIVPHFLVVDEPLEAWRRTIDLNCTSLLFLAQRILPGMIERRFGRIVALSIASDDRALTGHASAAAARAGLAELVKVIAVENGTHSVTANVVSQAMTEASAPERLAPEQLAALLAIPRPGKLSEIAFACTYLASDQGAFVTGQTLHVDGGYTV